MTVLKKQFILLKIMGDPPKTLASFRGFTLIELVIVILIAVILAITATVQSPNLPSLRTEWAAYKIKSDIRYAQSYAVASQKRTRVSFDVNAESYSIYVEDSPGNWVLMTDPLTKKSFTVDFKQSEFRGINIVSTYFNGANYGLLFDASGTPYSYDSSGGTTMLSTTGNVTLLGYRSSISFTTVYVTPNTGMVFILQSDLIPKIP